MNTSTKPGNFRHRDVTAPHILSFSELLAMKPRYQRGGLAPGERFPTGMRPGRRRARGVDLDSIGPYIPGDDIRSMDWRATARTGRAQMKRFVAESHVAQMLVVDFRAQMYFATLGFPLAKTGALLAARAAWEAVSLQEPVGLAVVGEVELIPPRRGRNHTLQILNRLLQSYDEHKSGRNESPDTFIADTLDRVAQVLHRGDTVTIYSDFGESISSLASVARRLASTRTINGIVIEDAIFNQPLKAGRYPLKIPGCKSWETPVISKTRAESHWQVARGLRNELRRKLVEAGIHVSVVHNNRFFTTGSSPLGPNRDPKRINIES